VLSALSRLETPRVPTQVLELYGTLDPRLQARVVELLTERPMWSVALVNAIDGGRVPPEALNLNQIRRLQASKDAALVQRVRNRFGTVRAGRSPAREKVIDRMRVLLRDRPGDPHAGVLVFKKLCGQCHKMHGDGQDVGPDITRNGRGSFEQLLSNVFDPSLVIGTGYQAITIATRDGRILTGLLAEESPQRIVLKTQGGKLETVARSDIEEMMASPLSLMPEDLEKQLSENEIRDLFSFLCLDRPPADPAARRIPGAPD
jgi:putative heme-binding domain-containing protein